MEKQPHPAEVKLSENRDQKFHRTLREIPGKKKQTAPTTIVISRQK